MALDLWVDFFEDLEYVRGRSKNTIMAYRRDLELFDEYKSQNDIAYSVQGFYRYMKEKNLSTRSQARAVSSLRTYFKFLQANGLPAPELRELRPPKVKVSLPKSLSEDDFFKLYKACQNEDVYRSGRNQITLLLLYGLGCRVSELIALNLEDYNEAEAHIRLVGKAGKERLVPLNSKLNKEIKDYLQLVRGQLLKKEDKSILINDRGKRPSRVDIWRWLSAWSERAGFDKTVHPHRFRHGCATALLESGADLRSIQMLLGHASLQTTQIYTSVTQNRMAKTVEEHHPLSGIQKDSDLSEV